ncbi:MAG: SAM-dependent chlorinase/fluorinase [Bacteroidetes bacterium]|nr:SAM-dependent chlorinase/fluorinase [Bacteroidota bacterium]
MPIITLTTDLGSTDFYVGSLKGAILSQLADVTIVDISHNVPLYNFSKAAFIVRNCYQDFPQGTIHIIGVNPEIDNETAHVAIYHNGHYFIGADNGMFSLIFDTAPDKIVELNINQDTDKITFPTRDVFSKAACHIARGGTLEVLGRIKNELNIRTLFQATTVNNLIKGMITYIDRYGNVHTNVSEDLFKNFGKGRKFTIYLRSSSYEITEISKTYNETYEGGIVAIFNTTGHIEIALNKGNAHSLLGLKEMNPFTIEFYD